MSFIRAQRRRANQPQPRRICPLGGLDTGPQAWLRPERARTLAACACTRAHRPRVPAGKSSLLSEDLPRSLDIAGQAITSSSIASLLL